MKKLLCAILMLYSINVIAGEWMADPDTGCQAWNVAPSEGESIKWSGSCKNNKANGKGVLQWYRNGNEGDRFEGVYKNGHMHGKGSYAFANGEQYRGDWRDSRRNGKGVTTWPNGDRYEGEYQDDRRQGYGVYYYSSDGKRREGEWQNDKLVAQVHNKRACDRLYAGKKVKATVSGLVNLFGITNEDAIIIGLSKEEGVATVQSLNNSQMIGEVHCDELQ